MHFLPYYLYQFLLLTIGECYTVHGKLYYQHRDDVFLYERGIFLVNQKVLKQQQSCRVIMPLTRILAETSTEKLFLFQ